jgi:6,7-dimethyl-8-ribityllumazine synthase
MPGLVPGIHVLAAKKDVDGRVKPGHDEEQRIPSYAGLTRVSILLTRDFSIKMDCRVKPGNDEAEMADARRAALKDQTDIAGARALIVEARFYDDILDALLEGALAELKAASVGYDVITVPGALEIPAAIAIALDAAEQNGKPYDAAIALGCVIRGDTIHFEIVSIESSRALMDLAVARRIPLGNGIITVDTEEQAWARARASELNKGGDAARAALAMLRIKRRLAKA